LNAPSDALAVRQALEEAIANREVEATLKALIRSGWNFQTMSGDPQLP
jgi:hypothetical protein